MSLAHALTYSYDRTPGAVLTGRTVSRHVDTQATAATCRERRVRRVRSARPARLQPPHRLWRHRRPHPHSRSLRRDRQRHPPGRQRSARSGATPGPISAPGSASPARLLSNAGAASMTHPAATAASPPNHTGSGAGRSPTTPQNHLLGRLPHLGTPARHLRHLLAPHPFARPHRGHRPHHRRDSPRSTTPPPSPAACCTSPAATAASPSARPARQVYKRDARQLVRAGLAGGKGIPETITAHPCVFATLTAPSLRPGPLPAHARQYRPALPTPPRRQRPALPARPRHLLPDPARRGRSPARPSAVRRLLRLPRAVLFNAYAGDLWRRFTTYLPRHLARLSGRQPQRTPRGAPHPLRQGR